MQAWRLAHELDLTDADVWLAVIKKYERIDPVAVLPVYRQLTLRVLEDAGVRNYQVAARHLRQMRKLAAGHAVQAREVDALITELRETHRRRPRLQTEFTKVGLP